MKELNYTVQNLNSDLAVCSTASVCVNTHTQKGVVRTYRSHLAQYPQWSLSPPPHLSISTSL